MATSRPSGAAWYASGRTDVERNTSQAAAFPKTTKQPGTVSGGQTCMGIPTLSMFWNAKINGTSRSSC